RPCTVDIAPFRSLPSRRPITSLAPPNGPAMRPPEISMTASESRASHLGHLDEHPCLRHAFECPQLPQQRIDAIGSEMSRRQRAKLLFHFSIGHRVFRVPAMVFDPNRLAPS